MHKLSPVHFSIFRLMEHCLQRKQVPAGMGKKRSHYCITFRLFFFSLFHQGDCATISSTLLRERCCASTTAILAILIMLRTELPNCNTCTGRLIPSKIGPMASAPPTSFSKLYATFPAAKLGKIKVFTSSSTRSLNG